MDSFIYFAALFISIAIYILFLIFSYITCCKSKNYDFHYYPSLYDTFTLPSDDQSGSDLPAKKKAKGFRLVKLKSHDSKGCYFIARVDKNERLLTTIDVLADTDYASYDPLFIDKYSFVEKLERDYLDFYNCQAVEYI